ncbi:MAG: hypothetical protein V7K39_16595, partial [Nostoc sp.]
HSRDLVGAGRSALPKYSRMTGTLFFRKSLTMEGKVMNYPDRWDQENLLNLHKAKIYLEMAIGLLSQ